MNCQGQRTLYLKANGNFVCEDDIGEQVTLGAISSNAEIDMAALIDGWHFRRMRDMMGADRAPWPLVCERCAFFRPTEPLSTGVIDRSVEKIQVETTLACKLKCPGCNGLWQTKNLPGPAVLSIEKYRAMLESCRRTDLSVEWIEYCGQGEPLSHKEFPKFMEWTRDILPNTKQRIITNGNFDFDSRFPNILPDQLIVSCDGMHQSSYEQYRIGGNISQVIEFMRRASERTKDNPTKTVVWKYILFAHNDGDDEIIAAQELAEEIGVDRLLFVMTHTRNKSRRFRPGTGEELPLRGKIARFNSTPVLYRDDLASESDEQDNSNGGRFIHAVIDEVRKVERGQLVRGWAIGDYGKEPSRVWLRDPTGLEYDLAVAQHRPDIALTAPHWANERTGFSGVVDTDRLDRLSLWATIGGHDLRIELPDEPQSKTVSPTT